MPMNKNIDKNILLTKLNKLDVKKNGITFSELEYLKEKIYNDSLGLFLNFEDREEIISQNNYLLLEEIKEFNINLSLNKSQKNNILIEGDNYHSLKSLITANVKVDVIYIDPPYNTGNKDFIYNDTIIDKDDQYKHSKWLSFMKKRLKLARELLNEDGVIFISIDDNEQAYLKVLMDEIFGENNFIATMARETKTGGGRYGKQYIQKDYDYLLVYSKDLSLCPEFSKYQNEWDDYKLEDSRGKYCIKHPLDGGDGQKSYIYPVIINNNTYYPREGKNWSFCKKRTDFMIENDFLVPKKNGIVYIKNYKEFEISDIDEQYEIVKKEEGVQWSSSKLLNKIYNNGSGKKDLEKLGITSFDYPKPINLLKTLIKMINNKSCVVLDFFAGSGTTGQAVLELNEEDGGNRRFILCTNNENGIAQNVCRERIYRVINGFGSNGEKIDWEYSKDKKSLSNNFLRYLKVKEIDKYDGDFEEFDNIKEIYKIEFDKEISIKDFNDNDD